MSDIHSVEFPPEKGIFQLLWHGDLYFDCDAFWRADEDHPEFVSKPDMQAKFGFNRLYECGFSPEQVDEYPSTFELDDDYYEYIDETEVFSEFVRSNPEYVIHSSASTDCYQYCFSVAYGTKIGGYCNWIQNPETPICGCGNTLEYFLTIASKEFDAASFVRWLPVEDRGIWDSGSCDDRRELMSPSGLCIGDCGNLFFLSASHVTIGP